MVDVYKVQIEASAKGVDKANKEMTALGASTGLATKAMRAFVPLVAAAFSARALSGLASQANEFSAAMAEVNTLLSGNTEMPRLTQEAKNLAAQFGGSPTQQAQAFYQAISAGAGNAEQATALLTAANKLAIGGVTNVTTAVDGLTSVTNAYGISTSEASRVSDAFFVAMRAGKTTVGELSGSIGKVAATAATAGLSFEETLGSISALTTQGIATAEAVTGLKATLSNILKPSKAASDAAKELGVDFSLAGLQSKGLAGFLDELVTATGGSEEKLLDLFGSTEALNTVFALTGGAAETFGNIMVDMANSAGQTDTAFAKVSNTMSQKLDVLQGKFAVTAVELGNFVVAASEPFVDALNANYDDFINYFKNLFAATKTTLNALIELWAPWASKISEIVSNLFGFIVELFKPFIKGTISTLKTFVELFYNAYKFIITGTETAIRNIVDFFRNGFTIFIPRFIEQTKIQIEAFYDTMVVKAKSFYETEVQTQRQLADINRKKERSLAAVSKKYAEQQAASENLADQTNITTGFFNTLEASVDVVTTTFGSMNTATTNLDDSANDLDTSLAAINSQTQALETNNTNAIVALDNSTAATIRNKDAQEIHKNMIENVQRSFGDLIYKTLDDGKVNFKSFFESVIDGFKRLVAELAAQKIMNAIFGDDGVNGFLTALSSGFGSIISSIASGLGAIISQFASSLAGLKVGGSSVGSGASGAGLSAIGASIASGMSKAGGFVSSVLSGGASATAARTAITAGTSSMAASAAAAAASSTAAGSIAAGTSSMAANAAAAAGTTAAGTGGFGSALAAAGPYAAAIVAAYLVGKALDSGGTPTRTAGLTMAKTGGMSAGNIFSMPAFASGFAPLGFKQNATNEEAMAAVSPLRELDSALTTITKEAGYNVNLRGHTFSGLGVEGTGAGTVLGRFIEDGKLKGQSIEKQMDNYAVEWIKAVGARNGIGSSALNSIIGDGTAAGIIGRATQVLQMTPSPSSPAGMSGSSKTLTVDGSHQGGLEAVPFDGYIAELHKGERVQTAAQVAATDTMTAEMVGLRQNLNELMMVVAKSVAKTARIEDRWDKNGLPPTRAQNEGY